MNIFFNELKDKFNINLTEQQKEIVLHKEKPCLVLAVPGAGKTTVLIARTAYLILNHKVLIHQYLQTKSILDLFLNILE